MSYYALKTKPSPQIVRTEFTRSHLGSTHIYSLCYAPDGTLWAGTGKGLLYFNGDRFVKVSGILDEVNAVYACKCGKVFAASLNTVYTVENAVVTAKCGIKESAIGILSDGAGNLWLATKSYLYKYDGASFVFYANIEYADSRAFTACGDGNVYIANPQSLMMLHGKRPRWGNMMRGMTNVPQAQITALKTDSLGFVWVGCEDGLHIYDGKSEWKGPESFDFFPKLKINVIDFSDDGTVYLGTDIGLYTVNGEKTRFYGSKRYLPDGKVTCVAAKPDGSEFWVGTEAGLSRIEKKPMLLSEKEKYYQQFSEYFKRENYQTKREKTVDRDITTGTVSITDNDGLWTAVYVAAECFRYAVTGEAEAKENAKKSMYAMMKLMTMTGVKGFPARAYRRPGEDRFGDGNRQWHLSSDETGELEWKGETSSDELVGHYLAAGLYFDLCADEEDKKALASCIRDVTDHILDNGYVLCDADGLPTTWAHFGPDELNLDDKWCWEKGINSLELMSFLLSAYHITGDKKYLDKKNELAVKYHYAMNILTHKIDDAHSCHIDDRLGYYTVLPFLRYETDPAIRRFVLLATRRHFEYERVEHCPIYTFITAMATEGHTDLSEAVEMLEEYPLDMFSYETCNSVRPDIEQEERVEEFGEAPHAKYAIPACERVMDDLCYNPFQLDGNKRDNIISPASWRLAYWFAKYYGMIEE